MTGTLAPAPWTVLSVVDTREFVEVDDNVWKPIPGSGDARECDRCGRTHEIHAHVRLPDGSEMTVGVGCAEVGTPEVAARIKSAKSGATTVARLRAQLAAAEVKAAAFKVEWDRVAALPVPEWTVVEIPAVDDGSGLVKLAREEWTTVDGLSHVWAHPGDSESHEEGLGRGRRIPGANPERVACLIDGWRRAQITVRGPGYGVVEDLRVRLARAEAKVAKLAGEA